MFKKSILTLACLLTAVLAAFTQVYEPEKWGKIKPEDLALTSCDFDTAASALVLQDIGLIKITSGHAGYEVIHSRNKRIKIFDVSAIDKGNLAIYHSSNKRDERLRSLDIQVTTPDGVTTKVKSDNKYTEQVNEYHSVTKVFVPNLQKGSIIEYSYELQSEFFFSLYDWYFQSEIPTRWSQLTVIIPNHLSYMTLVKSSKPFDLRDSKDVLERGVNSTQARYGLAHMPGVRFDEPYITTPYDYLAQIGFQLSGITELGYTEKKYITTWKDLAKKLEEHDDFGRRYRKSNQYDDVWKAFSAQYPLAGLSSKEKAEKALRFVSEHMVWSGQERIFCDEKLNDVFQKGKGSTSAINLTLIALLREAGLDANPLLISTRDHGGMFNQYPFLDQFNTVTALVRLDSTLFLLDATNPFHIINELHSSCYNGAGWVANAEWPEWVNIAYLEKSQTWLGQLSLDENGMLTGAVDLAVGGGMASSWRKAIKSASPKELIDDEWEDTGLAVKYNDIETQQIEVADQPLKFHYNCEIQQAVDVVNGVLYVKPVLDFYFIENPFKTLKRTFPVDFSSTIKSNFVCNLQLPKGYVIDELPKSAKIALPNEGGKLHFSCSSSNPEQIQVLLKMQISQTNFQPDEYEGLKKFFDLLNEKINSRIVLKKA